MTIEIKLTYNREGEIELVKDWHIVTLEEAKKAYWTAYQVDYKVNGVLVHYWKDEGKIFRS